ncbi:MAG: HEAT repeat domain-containing protein [Phycisphaerae bacterium]|nr:HEAT repeat domain-containing protein [Phycisphaerae bacterium]
MRGCVVSVALAGLVIGAGCAAPGRPTAGMRIDRAGLKHRALEYLRQAVGDGSNPAVRVAAVESLRWSDDPESLPWIRTALADPHPGVRFAGAVAVGELRDEAARSRVARLLDDSEDSVRAAAIFALHRLGDKRPTAQLGTMLLQDKDPLVRRNATMLLGMLGEPGSVPILARAMADRDPGVRQQALEAMARLGNVDARQELVFMTNAGVGADEVFALQALDRAGDPAFIDTFRYKLGAADHVETRLAAANGLARFGIQDGYELAMETARAPRATSGDPNDPAAGQMLRMRLLACKVLGTIGRADALPLLDRLLEESDDARVRVGAALAMLRIVNRDPGLFAGNTGATRSAGERG